MNVFTYPSAVFPLNGLETVASPRSHATSVASMRAQSVPILTSERSTKKLDVQHRRKECLRETPVEVAIERHHARRLEAERDVISKVGVGVEDDLGPAVISQPAPL